MTSDNWSKWRNFTSDNSDSDHAEPPVDFVDHLEKGIVTTEQFADLEIIPRPPVFDDWCLRGDLGFIFAPRGLGKTWLTMGLAYGAATKHNVGPWLVSEPRTVCYIDGEMMPWDVKRRLALMHSREKTFFYCNHEILCDRTDQIINLASSYIQTGILEYCKRREVELLCLDNLSCLATGVEESASLAWEAIQGWLLLLRRAGVTVIFIHHAGRNGLMRGTSKREDLASWIIQLDYPIERDDDAGAQFITRFTKWRCERQPPTWHWAYKTIGDDIAITWEPAEQIDVFISHVEAGLETCSQIATEMRITDGSVSRLAKRAAREGRISIVKRKYLPRNDDPF